MLADRPHGGAVGLKAAADLGPPLRQRRLQRRQQRRAIECRRSEDRLRQLLRQRPPVDDVALPQDVGHDPLLRLKPLSRTAGEGGTQPGGLGG